MACYNYRGVLRSLSNIKDGTFCENGFESLTIFAKRSILDVWQGSEYTSELHYNPLQSDTKFMINPLNASVTLM